MANIEIKNLISATPNTADFVPISNNGNTRKATIAEIRGVVNDLTTGGTDKSLSAEMGKDIGTEIIDARNGESNLKIRIDKEENDTLLRELESTGYGVISGLTISAQGTPNMTINVATGIVHMIDGVRLSPTGDNALVITTADLVNPRKDIIYAKIDNTIGYLIGTPASSPIAPATPVGAILLSEINVLANATSITNENITDKRKMKNTTDDLKTLVDSNVSKIGDLNGLATTDKNNLVNAINENTTQLSEKANNWLQGKIINFMGDSITYGVNSADSGNRMPRPFPAVVGTMLNCTTNNYGVSGSTICGDGGMCDRVLTMDTNASVNVVMGGVNDRYGILGTINDNTKTTIFGALNILCTNLINTYPNSINILITPLKIDDVYSNPNLTLSSISEAIIAIGNKYNFPVVDLYNGSPNLEPNIATLKTRWINDGIHPNQDYVDKFLARKITNSILSLDSIGFSNNEMAYEKTSRTITVGVGKNFTTIQSAINSVKKNISSGVIIDIVVDAGTYNETVVIQGFYGGGTLRINNGRTTINTIVNNVILSNCSIVVYINGINAISSTAHGFSISNALNTICAYISATVTTATYCGLLTFSCPSIQVSNSNFSNHNAGIQADGNSKIYSNTNSGTGNTYGLVATSNSSIGKNGTQPSGTTAEGSNTGGVIR
jgi:lysophospholipase L1-like esterase